MEPRVIGEALLSRHSKFTTGVVLDVNGDHQVRQYAMPNDTYAEMKRLRVEEETSIHKTYTKGLPNKSFLTFDRT